MDYMMKTTINVVDFNEQIEDNKYHIAKCECGMKKMKHRNKQTLDLYLDNSNYKCNHCKTQITYQGYMEHIEEDYVKIEKYKDATQKKNRKVYTVEALKNNNELRYNGMPQWGKGGRTSNSQLIPAFKAYCNDKNEDLMKEAYNSYDYELQKAWKYFSKKEKEYIKKTLSLDSDWEI